MSDLSTLAGKIEYRTTLEAALQEFAVSGASFSVEGFSYAGGEAYQNCRKEWARINALILAEQGAINTVIPDVQGIDSGDLSDA